MISSIQYKDLFGKYYAKAGAAQYKENVEAVRTQDPSLIESQSVDLPVTLNRKNSILKLSRSVQSLDLPKKKVHFPDILPRYTIEKRKRALNKVGKTVRLFEN